MNKVGLLVNSRVCVCVFCTEKDNLFFPPMFRAHTHFILKLFLTGIIYDSNSCIKENKISLLFLAN